MSGWHLHTDNDMIQLSLISNAPPDPSVVKQWECACIQKVATYSTDHDVICKYPIFIQSGQDLQNICSDLQAATPCEGNCEPDLVDE